MDGYEIIINQLHEMFKKLPYLEAQDQWLVKIAYKYDDEKSYTEEWTFIKHNYNYYGGDYWTTENDWCEGQTDCKLLAVFDEQEEKLIWRNKDE